MVMNRRGVTLIELLIVVAVVGVLAAMGPPILTNATRFFVLSKARLALQAEARSVMYIVTRELHEAQSSTIVIDQTTGQPYYSRIRFTKIQGQAVTIAQTGTTLTITQGNDKSVLTSDLAYLAFTFPQSDDMTIVSVSMTLQEQIYGGLYKALHMASEHIQVMD